SDEPNRHDENQCTSCVVLQRELDILRARHAALAERYKLLEQELVKSPKSLSLPSPIVKKTIDEGIPQKRPSAEAIDSACQSVFNQNNNSPQVIQAAVATPATRLFQYGVLFGYSAVDDFHDNAAFKRCKSVPEGKHARPALVKSPSSAPLWPFSKMKGAANLKSNDHKPKVMSVYPTPLPASSGDLTCLMELCFPRGEISYAHLHTIEPQSSSLLHKTVASFVLRLSGQYEVQYAMCVVTSADEGVLRCFCLVSMHPFFSLFFKVLHGIVALCNVQRSAAITKDLAIFDDVMNRLYATPVPTMGGWSCFRLEASYPLLTFHRPHTKDLVSQDRQFILEWTSALVFSKVSIDHLLVVLGLLSCEAKVIVLASDPTIVTSCVLALAALLSPLQWAGALLTLIPSRLDDLLDAPVPVLAGQVYVDELPPIIPSVVQLVVDRNQLLLHPSDMPHIHESKWPESDQLRLELHPSTEKLFGHTLTPQSIERDQVEACEHIFSAIQSHVEMLLNQAKENSSGFYTKFKSTQMYSVFDVPEEDNYNDESDHISDCDGESITYATS
ncbi:hypothetical protein THRCLA_11456, partial [Thraustotheca clavata]